MPPTARQESWKPRSKSHWGKNRRSRRRVSRRLWRPWPSRRKSEMTAERLNMRAARMREMGRPARRAKSQMPTRERRVERKNHRRPARRAGRLTKRL
jgi:hypothetical protein